MDLLSDGVGGFGALARARYTSYGSAASRVVPGAGEGGVLRHMSFSFSDRGQQRHLATRQSRRALVATKANAMPRASARSLFCVFVGEADVGRKVGFGDGGA